MVDINPNISLIALNAVVLNILIGKNWHSEKKGHNYMFQKSDKTYPKKQFEKSAYLYK